MSENYDFRAVREYFNKIRKIYLGGDFTELTFRTPFENFIERLSPSVDLRQEPMRKRGFGAPDFKAFYRGRKVGYIETKNIDENLDVIMESEQIKRYIDSVDNLILTNYLRFILIRKGEKIYDVSLLSLLELSSGKLTLRKSKWDEFHEMITTFFSYSGTTVSSAKELAEELSKRAKLLKDLAKQRLEEDMKIVEAGGLPSNIYEFYLGIKELLKDISIEDAADAYAQTVTYGLFLARKESPKPLDRLTAAHYIPKTVGIIKKIFVNISGDEFPPEVSWVIDEIVEVLNSADLNKILEDIDRRGKKDKDPIIYFYEDFLNFYEPEKKKHLGVYYTPRPVVNYIVNSLHKILKEYFNKPMGFAENDVKVLDPAIGTGTFFWITFLVVFNELKGRGLGGLIEEKIKNHVLKNFYGFEILITPYVISHLKLGDLVERWGHKFTGNERLQVYLTNTLEPSEVSGLRPFLLELTRETLEANKIKIKRPILVVMGNPPYSGISANNGQWINNLLKKGYRRKDGSKDDGYYTVDGKPLGEKNPKWLQDDYVKFIRYAQWKIDQNGEGIVGFITNHSYLDNPTFRGMRESLLQSFDRIYILNLHGNVKKKERAPDGGKDENVFDIQQGVAIGIFIKNPNFGDKKVFYADLWGTREEKYAWLDRHTIKNTEWQEIEPKSPFYFFVPRDTGLEEKYNTFWKVTDIFPVSSVGVVTSRDAFVTDIDEKPLIKRIEEFTDAKLSDEYIRQKFKLKDKKGWKLKDAREALMKKPDWKKSITKILYRPFETRYILYDDNVIERPRREVMHHMLKENVGLITSRQMAKSGVLPVFVSGELVDAHSITDAVSISYVLPLYLYDEAGRRRPNFSEEFLNYLREKYGEVPEPEEIFNYIYAVLHSPTYRKKYEEFLRYDFPRIPFVDDYSTFHRLAQLGAELVELHLMRRKLPTSVKFDVEGSGIVERVKYESGRVWINKQQYFEGIPEDVWNFHIGGYRVLDKWLKSRKGRKLSGEEIEQFLQIVEIIKETIRLMDEIDSIRIF